MIRAPHLVFPIENVLRQWEDLCFLGSVVDRLLVPPLVLEGPYRHFPEFRDHVLRDHEFDPERFVEPPRIRRELGVFSNVPIFVFQWATQGRRVYTLEPDLQVMLEATSLEGIRWGDISFPFDAFAVEFTEPIESPRAKEGYDFVIFFKGIEDTTRETHLNFVFLDKRFRSYVSPVTQQDRNEVERDLRRGNRARVRRKLNQMMTAFESRADATLSGIHFSESAAQNIDVTRSTLDLAQETISDEESASLPREDVPEWDRAIKLVVGLCLYLKTRPTARHPRVPHGPWEPVVRESVIPQAIVHGAQICTVSSVHRITEEERTTFRNQQVVTTTTLQPTEPRTRHELSPHFRTGHWRRRKGEGHIPDAPKTIWVHPLIVRKDRLREGMLPHGAKIILEN